MASVTRCMCLFLNLFIFTAGLQSGEGQFVITNTTLGPVMGVKTSFPPLTDQLVTRYTAIPYAEPPTGERRFSKPVPKAPWDDVLDATVYGPSCPQPGLNTSGASLPNTDIDEDCLLLNMFVPHDALALSGPLPVMIFIHGGGFIAGQGMAFDGTVLALHGQVVVVTINYRLGPFGFLSTGDDSAPGNYGLWDQRLAIQWVKDNIASFGGDPDQITIFGESAGASSVTYQMISPLNDRTLFQRVIAESGVVSPNVVIPGILAQFQAFTLGSILGCNLPIGSTSHDLISCLRGMSMESLLTQFYTVNASPTVDGELLPTDINTLLAHPRVGQYDLIMGFNDQDASVYLSRVDKDYTEEELRADIQYFVLICQCTTSQEITDAIFAYYFGGQDLEDPDENVMRFLDVTGDMSFKVPSINFLTRHAESAANTSTYFYQFIYETGKEYFLPLEWWDLISGAPHALELLYVFGSISAFYPNDLDAAILSNRTMDYLTQFARYGNPNGAGLPDLPEWPEFETENGSYIILDPGYKTGQRFKPGKVAFWNDYIPTITEPEYYKKACLYEVPVRRGTLRKPDNMTVQISGKDGEVLGSVVGALRVADEAMGGQEIAEYLGIPYAKPPLGELRFRPPEDTGKWGDEPLGIPEKLPPACPQDVTRDPWMVRLGFNQTSEDCLTLNIYAPTQDPNDPALPVLVFIHGGDAKYGTSSVYDATLLASRVKAVVVVMNYRLGALGFLSTEDEVAPGNYGLHDTLAALKWVNKYIGSFGGNPERVTVQGYGSGAILAHMLTLSETAKGLFNRAVLMSATAITPPVDNPVLPSVSERAKTLASKLGCPTETSDMMVSCLRDKPAADLVSITISAPFGLAFPTVVDGDLITDKPLELLKAGRINDVDILVGLAQDGFAGVAFAFTGLDCPSTAEVQQYIDTVSSLCFTNPDKTAFALATEYIGKGGLDDDCQTRGSFRQFINDYLSYWSTLEAARLHADAGHSVYFYSFNLKPPAHYYKGPLPPQVGPTFADDLQFLFGDPYSPLVDELQLSYRLEDKRFTQELMAFLEMFTYNGAPGSSLSGVKWPAFDSANLTYMSLTDCPQALSGNDNNWQHLLRFWASYLPSITAPAPTPPEPTPCPPEPTPCPPDRPCPPDPEPCTVSVGGLRLPLSEASTVIAALIGTTVGVGVLAIIFLGLCVANKKARANGAEKENRWMEAGVDLTHIDTRNDSRIEF
ncbi:neuroligin-4, X-linked-like [Patiria miniata]|uniref:Carboxylesterase type B domain-containing protein n=1 Tax=Patiria miniata TaxID=46514 RepID=A0A914AD29_PATMI|nr:neuroligin-4, X-linked-like [Patiria miniata]